MNTLPSSGGTLVIVTCEDGARDNFEEIDMMEILALLARGPVAAHMFTGAETKLRILLDTRQITIDQGGTYRLAACPNRARGEEKMKQISLINLRRALRLRGVALTSAVAGQSYAARRVI